MSANRFLVIMAGGIGTRLWPYSRKDYPKQFHDILGVGKTLLQMTADRFEGLIPQSNILVVTNKDYQHLVKEQLPWIENDHILLEPSGKNTAPCIAYAGYKIASKVENAVMTVAPADHHIADVAGFQKQINTAMDLVEKHNVLMTLGIKPSRPDTGYGYIQFLSEHLGESNKVKTFTEKPELDLAKKFLESGDFLWNSGIFLWNANTLMEAFRSHEPDIHELFMEGWDQFYSTKENIFIESVYSQTKSISIDYAIMEKAPNVYTLMSDFGWSDLGTWKSLYETVEKDSNSNLIDAFTVLDNSQNCVVKSSNKNLLIVAEGLKDYLVIENDGVLLICPKDKESHIKDVMARLKQEGKSNYL